MALKYHSIDQARMFHGRWSNVLAKTGLFVVVVYAVINALTGAPSASVAMLDIENISGWLVIMTLAAAGAIVFFDITVNDIASEKVKFDFGMFYRRWIYVLISALFLMIGYASSTGGFFRVGSAWLFGMFSGIAIGLGAIDSYVIGRARRTFGDT